MQEPAVRLLRDYNRRMRYLVRARVKAGREADLLKAIENGTLGCGSVAEGEYLRNMKDARVCEDQTTRWVEVVLLSHPATRGASLLGKILRSHSRTRRS